MKTCTRCGQTLDLSFFHNDATTKDHHASACKSCRNRSKRKAQEVKSQIETIEIPPMPLEKPVKIPVKLCLSLEDLIQELLLKHRSFLNITINRSGVTTLQIFSSDMKRTYSGLSVESLVELVGREEGL